jgi:glycosyltransferase involved in cell wall biosynthesis
MPAYNEAAAIGNVVSGIPAAIAGMEVVPIVVDDGSSDWTSEAARAAGATVVRHLTNLGVGAATRTGFEAARRLDADFVVTMDADGQHAASDIEMLVACARGGPYDVVIGSRLIHPRGMPLSRVAANWVLNAITLVAYRGTVSDSQSGFKCLSRRALDTMRLEANRYDICSEIVGEIFSNGLRYRSVPVKAVYTNYSRAKGQHFLNGVNIIIQLLIRMMRRV